MNEPTQTTHSNTTFRATSDLTDLLYAEEADVSTPSDLIMTRSNPDDGQEEEDSDTDDIDHSSE